VKKAEGTVQSFNLYIQIHVIFYGLNTQCRDNTEHWPTEVFVC